MKRLLLTLSVIFTICSCVENTVDSQFQEDQNKPLTLHSLITRSGMVQEDSLVVKSKLQSDVDNLMMGRVLFKDSVFVLSLKKEDATFLGVSDEVYDRYLDYVDRLNESLQE